MTCKFVKYSILFFSLKKFTKRNPFKVKNKQTNKQKKKQVENFPDDVVDENSPANAGDMGLIPGLERFHTSQSK